jgi:hypothetical protein
MVRSNAMRAARTTIVAAVVCALAACSLTTDLDGLVGGGATPVTTDDAAISDANANGNPDGNVKTDGSSDGSSDAPADGPIPDSGRFCSTVPNTVTFCADFDDGPLPGPFAMLLSESGGTVTLENEARSAPKAVLFTTPSSGSNVKSSLLYSLAKNLTKVIFELDLRVDAVGNGDFDLIVLDAGTPEVGIQLDAGRAISWDEDIQASSSIVTPTGLTLGTEWTHLRLTFTVSGATVIGDLVVEGKPPAQHTFEAKVFTNGDVPVLSLGDDSFQTATTPWRVRVDNFTVDAH